MKNKVLKVVITAILIIAMTISDFILVGINIVHALENIENSTNHENVKYATYFKTKESKKVSQAEYQIDNTEIKLYMEIAVKNEGYFDGVITLEDSNFKLKKNILCKEISSIEGNTIKLNRVRAGNTIEIEVGIEPIITQSYGADMLSKKSVLKLTGEYKDSTEKAISIVSAKEVALSFTVPNTLETKLEAEVITNKIYKIGEENKKIVQLELNSSVVENAYPIKASTFEISLPEGVEQVQVISKGTHATNGQAERELQGYTLENNTLKITIENQSKDGKISWEKSAKDNLIITLLLGEEVKTDEEYNVKSKIEFLGTERKEIEKEVKYSLTSEVDGLIEATIENKENIYKGKIYSQEEREYNTTTNLEINYANLIEATTFIEQTTYRTDTENKIANVEYKTTTISKAEIETILGVEGKLILKDQNGNILTEITNNTMADENGNIAVTYVSGVKELTVEITKALNTGIIRLNHTKVIKAEHYSKEEINSLKYLVENVTVKYEDKEENFETINQFQETKTVPEVTVDRNILSTATVNEQVKIGITLRTDSEQYDLYKNPTINIKFPEGTKRVSNIKSVALYRENFTIEGRHDDKINEINIELTGEQNKYNTSNTNCYIEITADIELEETMPSRQEQITVTVTNEKAVNLENNGVVIVPMQISGFNGLVNFNRITNYNLKTNSVSSKEEQIGKLKMNEDATVANFQIALVNNTNEDLKNVNVIGNLPVKGNVAVGDYTFENTVEATLKTGISVETGNATIYYTNNSNATSDLGKSENGWNSDLSQVNNPVLYMVAIPNMQKETNFIANYTMNIPENLSYDKDMKTTYVAHYETELSSATEDAMPVGLETGKVLATLEAIVGTEKLENDGVVKAGEVIRYKLTVTNTGSNDAKNVRIKGLVPEGTILVEPVEEFKHAGEIYYNELEGVTAERTIETLLSQESQTFEYEVRVKNKIDVEFIQNQAIITYNDDVEVKSNILTNKLEAGNIRVTVKRVATLDSLIPRTSGQYFVVVENISDEVQENIKVKFNMPSEEIFTLINMEYIGNSEQRLLEINNEWTIDSIPAYEYKIYSLHLELNQIEETKIEVQLNAVATQGDNQYRSNIYDEVLYGVGMEIKMTSPNEGQYLKTDDNIEYHIEIKNNSELAMGVVLKDKIPEQLSIQKIEIDGMLYDENRLNNVINAVLHIKEQSTMIVKVFTIVNYDRNRLENETISNIAEIQYAVDKTVATQSISHIIESIVVKDVESEEPSDYPSDDPANDPENPGESEEPENPNIPNLPEKDKFNISGKAWVDQNKDGEMNDIDTTLESIKVKLLNIETNQFVRDMENNKDLVVETNKEGYYEFINITEGNYLVVFEYDKTLYKPTTYQKENIAESKNSNVVSKILLINGVEKEYAITDEIKLNKNISNVNMGLEFIKQFDIELKKYVSKVIVQTSKDTITYNYKDKDFARVDINAKRMVGSTIIVQYTIKVKNIGDVDAYVNSIVDYLPSGFKFSSELNTQWYEHGTDLYTNCLENTAIAPGESKEVNLLLTKIKTDGNAELINNMAEIHDNYNIYGIADTNSIVGNKHLEENDLGSADLMISIQTGTLFNYIALVISMIGIIGAGVYLINKKVLHIKL